MRSLLQWLLTRPLTWMNEKLAGAPKREIVFKSLSHLLNEEHVPKNSRLKVIECHVNQLKLVVFSDQHKGNQSWADDFNTCKFNYINALNHYNGYGYTFINLGDSEELWKFKLTDILHGHADTFVAEAAFQNDRFYKTFGNHDLIWKNKLDVDLNLKKVFRLPLPVYEGILIKVTGTKIPLSVLFTHGHQGDLMSDNNAFSTWLVAHIWTPLQRYLRINPNSPRNDFRLRNDHNKFMYEWSSKQESLLLVTGHTHQPVFASGRYYDHPSNKIEIETERSLLNPSYFNSGCCCFNDGDITGIEISDQKIRLVKWFDENQQSKRRVLEEVSIAKLIDDLKSPEPSAG